MRCGVMGRTKRTGLTVVCGIFGQNEARAPWRDGNRPDFPLPRERAFPSQPKDVELHIVKNRTTNLWRPSFSWLGSRGPEPAE